MKRIIFLFLFLSLIFFKSSAQFTHAGRGMYVDKFFRTAKNTSGATVVNPVFSILGVEAKEDSLLNYARENHITYLILYDLHYIFGNATFENYLCAFITKAKTKYCIEKIGAASSCTSLFDNVFSLVPTAPILFSERFNSNRYSSDEQSKLSIVETQYFPGDSLFYLSEATKFNMRLAVFNDGCTEKFDLMVSEYEFWNASVDDCLGDLPTKDQKYLRYQTLINNMDVIRDNYNSSHATHQIYVETYLGYINQNSAYSHQAIANWIDTTYNGKRRVDRINNHYYGTDPSRLYSRTTAGQNNSGYYLTRFLDFCQSSTANQTNFQPIFSSEYIPWGAGGSYLGGWFSQNVNNNIFTAEKYFYDDWYDDAVNYHPTTVGSLSLGTVVQPGGVVWFSASQLVNHLNDPVLFTSNSPVCVPSGQNGSLQFQYQGPIEQGVSYKFYITNSGNSTIRCGSANAITWPVYNPVTQTSIDLNAVLNGCTLPAGNYDVHFELNYNNDCSDYIAPVTSVSIVNTSKIVALTPTTVCDGNPVYLQASSSGGGTTTYAWYDGSTVISGATSSTFAPSASSTGSHTYSCLITSSISGCSANRSNTIPVTINTYPSASITTQSTSSCSVTLLANPTGGNYVWNDGSTGTTYTTSFTGTYSVAVTKNGCKSNSPNFTVSSISGAGTVTPSVSISANTGNTICSGATVIFTATPSYSGSAPVFQWKKNGSNVGTNSNTYTISNLVNNDIISCVMTSNLSCASPLTATSNSITMSVNAIVTPSVIISSGSGNSICNATNVTFTATPTNGGTAPVYQWRKNGINVGANSNTYSDNLLANSDVINCIMTGNATCPSAVSVTSNSITLTVNQYVVPSINIVSNSGSSVCAGVNVTFTATPVNGGAAPVYQWKKNGANVGSNSITYSTTSLANNNVITCVMTSNLLCVLPVSATSNGITMTVTTNVTPSLTISANPGSSICAGTNVTFTAIPVNGGSAPVYQWKKNGNNIGTNSNTYSDNSLTNNAVISCTITSNLTCVSSATAASSNITMTVNQFVSPTVSINANPGNSICLGTNVIFTAIPVNGGSAPSYQWKKSGINVGTNSSIYSDNSLANNNIITCVMASNASCASPLTANSNSIAITLNNAVTPSVTISIDYPNTICEGKRVTFTAQPVNGGANPSYQWKRNGNVVGTNNAVYSDITLANNDVIVCKMTSSEACAIANPATSNSITMSVNSCVEISVKLFIQGFYLGGNQMISTIDPLAHPTICDTISIELHNSNSPYNILYYTTGTIDINGNGQFIFPAGIINQSFYLVVRHRNALETWSQNPLSINISSIYYDFSTAANKAYGSNQVNLGDGNFALWSGDVSNGILSGIQDGLINNYDYLEIQNSLSIFNSGYIINDLTGDGLVESTDYSLVEHNDFTSVSVSRP